MCDCVCATTLFCRCTKAAFLCDDRDIGWHGEELDGCGHHQTDSMQYHDCAYLHTHLLYVFVSLSLSLSIYLNMCLPSLYTYKHVRACEQPNTAASMTFMAKRACVRAFQAQSWSHTASRAHRTRSSRRSLARTTRSQPSSASPRRLRRKARRGPAAPPRPRPHSFPSP